MARVEHFTVYFATCPTCGWQGPDRESERDTAEDDAHRHTCRITEHTDGGR